MTTQEAIEKIEKQISYIQPYSFAYRDGHIKALNMAVDALENHAVMKMRIDTLIADLEKCIEAEKKDHKQYFTAELMILRLKDIEVQNG